MWDQVFLPASFPNECGWQIECSRTRLVRGAEGLMKMIRRSAACRNKGGRRENSADPRNTKTCEDESKPVAVSSSRNMRLPQLTKTVLGSWPFRILRVKISPLIRSQKRLNLCCRQHCRSFYKLCLLIQ